MIINGESTPTYAAEAQARMRYWLGDPGRSNVDAPLSQHGFSRAKGASDGRAPGMVKPSTIGNGRKAIAGYWGGRCRRTPRQQGFRSAPRETRTPTPHKQDKALNLARLPIPPQARGDV